MVLLIKPKPSASLDLKVPNVLWNAKISHVTSCENCSIDLFSLYVLLSYFRLRDAHALKGICLLSFLQSPSRSPRYRFPVARSVPLDKSNADSGNEIVFSWIKLRMPTHGNRTTFDSITCNHFSKLSNLNTRRVQALAFSLCKSLVDVSFPPWHPSCKCQMS